MGIAGAQQRTQRPGHNQGRQALLHAAIEIVAEKGLRGLTYRSVSKAAGVSYGLVSHHFGSRDALISEALAYSVESLEHATTDRPGPLEDFASELGAFIAESELLLAFQYDLTMEARRRPELSADIRRMYTDVYASILARLDEFGIVDEDQLAWFILAAIDGMILQQIVFGDQERTQRGTGILQKLLAARREE